MGTPDRPTREQVVPARYSRALVDEALAHADDLADWSAKVDRQVLAAEVRALRAEIAMHDGYTCAEMEARCEDLEGQVNDASMALSRAGHAVDIRHLGRSVRAALTARTPQSAAPSTGDLLRAAAAGRREYAGKGDVPGADDLLAEAATLECAAQVADGDMGPLYGWLPSWRWTPEMDQRVLSSTSASTSRADVAGVVLTAPLSAVPDEPSECGGCESPLCEDCRGPIGGAR